MRTSQIVAGALFEFVAHLTTLREPLVVWSLAEPGPIVTCFREWAADKGLDLDEADVAGWNKSMLGPKMEPFEAQLSADALRKIEEVVRRAVREGTPMMIPLPPPPDDDEIEHRIIAEEYSVGQR